MSQQHSLEKLPTAIAFKLRSVQRRQLALTTTRGIAIGIGVLLVGLVVAMTVDWLFLLLSPTVRTLLTISTLVAGVAALGVSLTKPLLRILNIQHAANAVDANVPHLQERWSTVTSLAENRVGPVPKIQQLMQDQVANEAVAMHTLVQPASVMPLASLKRPLGGLVMCAVFLTVFMAIHPQQTVILWKRFWSPTKDITATQLIDENQIDLVPRGELIELVFRQEGVPHSNANLTIEYPGGLQESTTVRSENDERKQFVHSMRADESFQFRMTAGDGRTQWHSVNVIDYPEIGEVKFKVIAPEYVGREDVEKKFIPRRVKVIEGTKLVLAIRPKSPLQRLEIHTTNVTDAKNIGDELAKETSHQELYRSADGWYYYERTLVKDVTIEPTLWSEHGLENESRSICKIQTLADAAPVGRVLSPTDEMSVAKDEVIEIEFEAHDDHGIAKAELVIYDDSRQDEQGNALVLESREIPLGDQLMKKHLIGKTQLDLNDFALEENAEISYAIRVTDNHAASLSPQHRDDEHQIASSETQGAAVNRSDKTDARTMPSKDKSPTADEEANELNGIAKSNAPQTTTAMADRKENSQGREASPQMEPRKQAQAETPADAQAEPQAETQNNSKIARNAESSPDVARAERSRMTQSNSEKRDASEQNPQENPSVISSVVPSTQSGQNTVTNRRRLKITERLAAIAERRDTDESTSNDSDIRGRILEIDQELAISQAALNALVHHTLPDSTRGEKFKELDVQIGTIEKTIAELREETQQKQYAFVGLQMVDIARFHLTPARDRVFASIRRPGASDLDAKVAFGHINRARDRLGKLLKRYDEVKQDRDLKKELDESIPMFEVYVENSQRLLRAAQQNRNPLTRRMSVINVDQDYLDQYAENLNSRRKMLNEFSEMLDSDPRLLSRYMELGRRRNQSMRNRLSDLTQRQDEMSYELMGWLEIDEQQKEDLWSVIVEMRIGAADQLNEDVSDLAERIVRQLPLAADPTRGTPLHLVRAAESMTLAATNVVTDCQSLVQEPNEDQINVIREHGDELVTMSETIEALLDQLQVEEDGVEEFTDFVQPRLLEIRIVGAQCDAWAATLDSIIEKRYSPIVALEQHALAAVTQQLRMEMQDIPEELANSFRRQDEAEVPDEVIDLVSKLLHLMDSITMNQVAATIAAKTDDLQKAAEQQSLALERLGEAEELFDSMRRAVVNALDDYQEPDPNVADLRDPTLDEFLARLEREPNIAAELGIPNRSRNLRVFADSMLWGQQGQNMLSGSSDQLVARANRNSKSKFSGKQGASGRENDDDQQTKKPVSKEQQEKLAEAKRQQETMEAALLKIEDRAKSKNLSEKQRRRLDQLANDLRRLIELKDDDQPASVAWQRNVESDNAENLLEAIGSGEAIPDDQWNRLFSTLEDGLWQVRGTKPPEEYRKAIRQYQDSLRDLVGHADGV